MPGLKWLPRIHDNRMLESEAQKAVTRDVDRAFEQISTKQQKAILAALFHAMKKLPEYRNLTMSDGYAAFAACLGDKNFWPRRADAGSQEIVQQEMAPGVTERFDMSADPPFPCNGIKTTRAEHTKIIFDALRRNGPKLDGVFVMQHFDKHTPCDSHRAHARAILEVTFRKQGIEHNVGEAGTDVVVPVEERIPEVGSDDQNQAEQGDAAGNTFKHASTLVMITLVSG